jgi:hypothetical protein
MASVTNKRYILSIKEKVKLIRDTKNKTKES